LAPFLCERIFKAFFLITVWLCNFVKNIGATATRKMLAKLTTTIFRGIIIEWDKTFTSIAVTSNQESKDIKLELQKGWLFYEYIYSLINKTSHFHVKFFGFDVTSFDVNGYSK